MGRNLSQQRGGSSFKAEGTPYGRPVAAEGIVEPKTPSNTRGDRASLVVGRVGVSSLCFSFSQGRNKCSQVVGTRFNSEKGIPRQDETVREKCYKNPGNG